MSLILALDRAVDARRRLSRVLQALETHARSEDAAANLQEGLLPVYDHLSGMIRELESALLPADASAAVTFFPFRGEQRLSATSESRIAAELERGYSVPRAAGEPRGTLLLPAPEDE